MLSRKPVPLDLAKLPTIAQYSENLHQKQGILPFGTARISFIPFLLK
jgi:hypothetical protein